MSVIAAIYRPIHPQHCPLLFGHYFAAIAGAGPLVGSVLVAHPPGALRSEAAWGAKAVRWWVINLMGDRSYDVYVAHRRTRHPDAQILGEKEFWRAKYRDPGENPGARC